jgi:hypothetical protein
MLLFGFVVMGWESNLHIESNTKTVVDHNKQSSQIEKHEPLKGEHSGYDTLARTR